MCGKKLEFSQDVGGWLKSWEEIEGTVGASIAVGSRAAPCELWLSGDARSSVLDDAPARGNANEIDVIHLCFDNSSEIGL